MKKTSSIWATTPKVLSIAVLVLTVVLSLSTLFAVQAEAKRDDTRGGERGNQEGSYRDNTPGDDEREDGRDRNDSDRDESENDTRGDESDRGNRGDDRDGDRGDRDGGNDRGDRWNEEDEEREEDEDGDEHECACGCHDDDEDEDGDEDEEEEEDNTDDTATSTDDTATSTDDTATTTDETATTTDTTEEGGTTVAGSSSSRGGAGGACINCGTNDNDDASTTPEVVVEVTEPEDEGEVLGAVCTPLLTTFMREGQANDASEVTKLQTFLNTNLGKDILVTGIFDAETTSLVNEFQVKYWEDVLLPWVSYGLATEKTPTGYVYKTTRWKVNALACPELSAPKPELP
jgi:hypothetical protein